MAYTEEQVEALEKLATLAARARKAEQSILKAERGPTFAEESHAKMMAAHDRFMDRRRAFAMRNPNVVPGHERAMILGDIQREGLRKHEMDMLDKRNAGMIGVAEKKAEGLRNQGLGVATENNNYKMWYGNEHDEKMRKLEMENAMALAEKQCQGAIDLETQRGKNAKTLAETQNAGAEKVETIRGDYGVKAATEQARGAIAREQMRRENKQAEIEGRIRVQIEKNKGKLDVAKVKAASKIIEEAIADGAALGKGVDQVMSELNDANENNPEMLKFIKLYQQGTSTSNWNM